uniref:Uncharacterized protein n=1 Tax=Arundo donax TaxID=35708 RepID=A0A0A8Z591_ARUDO
MKALGPKMHDATKSLRSTGATAKREDSPASESCLRPRNLSLVRCLESRGHSRGTVVDEAVRT